MRGQRAPRETMGLVTDDGYALPGEIERQLRGAAEGDADGGSRGGGSVLLISA